jgi:ABC-2 type transport system ATP-binding protein
MLKATNLRKQFANVLAVDDVSFEVRRGEIFGLLGPNGAGKTTTIRMVLNILESDGGDITYDDRKFSEGTRNIVGYLPEERGLYKKNKLFDTILYFAKLRGMQPGEAKAEIYKWLKRFNLLEYKERKLEELSKGNQQKVQFIISAIHDPELIVLDEPFSGLDPVNQILFKDILLELRDRNKAVIFSTHQMDQAEKLSDTLCLINKGRVVLSGTVADVKGRYGKNSIHLEYSGDGRFMDSLQGVRSAIVYKNAAEIELEDGADIQVLLSLLIPHIEIRKFEVLEPSLQSIFLDIVGVPEGTSGDSASASMASPVRGPVGLA